MKPLFRICYHLALVGLFVLAVWSVVATAQTNEPVAAAATNMLEGSAPVLDSTTASPNSLSFGLDRVGFLRQRLLGQPAWKFVASLIYILLALYSSRLINWLVSGRLRKLAARTATRVDDVLIEIMHGPVKVVCFVVFLHVGLQLFDWPAWIQEYLSKALRLVVAWSVTYMIIRAVGILLAAWQTRLNKSGDRVLDDRLIPLFRKVITITIVTIAVLLTIDNLGIKITSLLAGLSVGGLALGLAAQDTVANLFGAVAIFMDKPFRIGDRITFEGVDGNVEEIGLRSTQIRNLDGHLITVPNKTVGNATITNISRRPNIKTVMALGLTYSTPPEKIREARTIVEKVFQGHAMTSDLIVAFNKFADFSLTLTVVHWWGGTDYRAYLDGMHELNIKVKEEFDAAGIDFAFPTQTLHLKQDSEWRLQPPPA